MIFEGASKRFALKVRKRQDTKREQRNEMVFYCKCLELFVSILDLQWHLPFLCVQIFFPVPCRNFRNIMIAYQSVIFLKFPQIAIPVITVWVIDIIFLKKLCFCDRGVSLFVHPCSFWTCWQVSVTFVRVLRYQNMSFSASFVGKKKQLDTHN